MCSLVELVPCPTVAMMDPTMMAMYQQSFNLEMSSFSTGDQQ